MLYGPYQLPSRPVQHCSCKIVQVCSKQALLTGHESFLQNTKCCCVCYLLASSNNSLYDAAYDLIASDEHCSLGDACAACWQTQAYPQAQDLYSMHCTMQATLFIVPKTLTFTTHLQWSFGIVLGTSIAHQCFKRCMAIFCHVHPPVHCHVSVRQLKRQLLEFPAANLLLRHSPLSACFMYRQWWTSHMPCVELTLMCIACLQDLCYIMKSVVSIILVLGSSSR